MIVKPVKTRVFKEGEELLSFIRAHIPRLKNGSVLVIASKIVSLSEGRTASLSEREKLIKKESEFARKTKKVWLTVKGGIVMANAGIDESNANGKLILLPKDSYSSASSLRRKLRAHYKIKHLGVIISDSVVMPRRKGVVGVSLGYAGFYGVKDYKGKKDLFGRKFRFASSNVADSLATAAILTMGEGNEHRPLAVIEGPVVRFAEKTKKSEIKISKKDDMFCL